MNHRGSLDGLTERATDNEVASRATIRVMVARVRKARYSLQSGWNSDSDASLLVRDDGCDDVAGDASRTVKSVLRAGGNVFCVYDKDSMATKDRSAVES